MLKLDFCNAFNSIRRDRMLEAVRDLAPAVYLMVQSAYSAPFFVFWGGGRGGNHTIMSTESIQQGDPLVTPIPFCLLTSPLHQKSAFYVMYLYLVDVTIGGDRAREHFARFECHEESQGPCTIEISRWEDSVKRNNCCVLIRHQK